MKLFVGRLPFDFTNEKLEKLFAPVGTVLSAIMVPDPKNGRSRGFGFVTMKTDEENLAAIQKLNGTRLGEKEIWVTEAKEKNPKPPKASKPFRPAVGEPESWPGRRNTFGKRPTPRSDFPSHDRKSFGNTSQGDVPPRRPNRFGPRPSRPSGNRFNRKGPRD